MRMRKCSRELRSLRRSHETYLIHLGKPCKIDFVMNFYEILGVETSASFSEIKSAFHVLAKTFHPDRNCDGEAQFRKIHEAYLILSNETLRARYDDRLFNDGKIIVDSVVHLDDFNFTGCKLEYSCRCGGTFQVNEHDLEENLAIPCSNCSLFITMSLN